MKATQFLLSTRKEVPADADIISQQLMLRAGMISKTTSGIYTWLPLGQRVLNNVMHIIRDELNQFGAQEMLMPFIQPEGLWQESGRWDVYGSELLKLQDRHQRSFCFGPTHEEVITQVARQYFKSYKQLPQTLYQIQTKFRDEIRPRFGVMRAREFLMKDAYSFHETIESMQNTYEQMFNVYRRIFDRLGLDYRSVEADPGEIGGNQSHEFHVIAQSGEDELIYCPDSDFAANRELDIVKNASEGDPSPDGQGSLKVARGIEVGHVFQLGDKYSRAMDATIMNQQGQAVSLQMACYGIGVARVVAAAIEQNYDERGIIWSDQLAPFQIAIVPLQADRDSRVATESDRLYQRLTQQGYSVLLDDRAERPGVKFADMDLIGIPHRLVINPRLLQQNQVEYKQRCDTEPTPISEDDLIQHLNQAVATNSSS